MADGKKKMIESLGAAKVLRVDVGTRRGNLGEKGSRSESTVVAFGSRGAMRS